MSSGSGPDRRPARGAVAPCLRNTAGAAVTQRVRVEPDGDGVRRPGGDHGVRVRRRDLGEREVGLRGEQRPLRPGERRPCLLEQHDRLGRSLPRQSLGETGSSDDDFGIGAVCERAEFGRRACRVVGTAAGERSLDRESQQYRTAQHVTPERGPRAGEHGQREFGSPRARCTCASGAAAAGSSSIGASSSAASSSRPRSRCSSARRAVASVRWAAVAPLVRVQHGPHGLLGLRPLPGRAHHAAQGEFAVRAEHARPSVAR